MKKNKIINLGCRLNIYEGELIKTLIEKSDLSNLTIINSCAVTQDAEKKVQYEIRRAKRNFPNNKIIVTGCAAQINPKKYDMINEVDFVIGNKEKLNNKIWESLSNIESPEVSNIFLDNSDFTKHHLIEKFEGKARAYIEIQQGCNHRCTFCVIPYGRGNNRSVPIGIIIDRINLLLKNGYKEVVLTGVDITDYGKDLPGSPNLFQLIKRIFNLAPELKQLRLSSIDCAEINDDFWPLLEEPKFMPYLHLSLQAGNDLILKRMKRRHSKKDAINFCKKLKRRRNDFILGADIIAGFPTETEDMFKDSIELINECDLTHLHIFPFSPRKLTPAEKMPQVEKHIIKKRAKILRTIGEKKLSEHLNKQVGKKTKMLVEQYKAGISSGKSEQFTKIKIKNKLTEGNIIKCMIKKVKKNYLEAEVI